MGRILFIYGLIAFSLLSCAKKEEFGLEGLEEGEYINASVTYSNEFCPSFDVIRPKVDFLFLWDNSGSANYISPSMISSLQNTITQMSLDFNYRILLAPILPTTPDTKYLMTYDSEGLNSSAISMVIPSDNASRISTFGSLPKVAGSIENGIERAYEIINGNISNGVFRENSYVFTVVISNGNDNSWINAGSPQEETNYLNEFRGKFLTNSNSLRNRLNSSSMRFFSLVTYPTTSQSCPGLNTWIPGMTYRKFSHSTYAYNYYNYLDQVSNPAPGSPQTDDSFDICSNQYSTMFSQINENIKANLVGHVYNYALVATTTEPAFDPGSIEVEKNTGVKLYPNTANGFNYVGLQTNQNMKLEPSPGEPRTGYMIQLLGDGKLTHPECIKIKTTAPADYYGYIVTQKEPDLNTVEFKINDQVIPQSNVNGWEFIGFNQSQNIKVVSPSNLSPQLPAQNRTGYVFKLRGSAVFTNNDTYNITYKPKIN